MSPGRFSGHSEMAPFVNSLKVGLPTHWLAAIDVRDGHKRVCRYFCERGNIHLFYLAPLEAEIFLNTSLAATVGYREFGAHPYLESKRQSDFIRRQYASKIQID
jgi:hypothetical protein